MYLGTSKITSGTTLTLNFTDYNYIFIGVEVSLPSNVKLFPTESDTRFGFGTILIPVEAIKRDSGFVGQCGNGTYASNIGHFVTAVFTIKGNSLSINSSSNAWDIRVFNAYYYGLK